MVENRQEFSGGNPERAVEDSYLVIHEYITEIWTFYESPNDGSVCHSMKTHIIFLTVFLQKVSSYRK